MTLLLAGDIGGTKTLLSLSEVELTEAQTRPTVNTRFEQQYVSQDFFDLVPMVECFLAEATQALGETPALQKACFAIAGPVVNNTSKLTNLSWSLDAQRLQTTLGIAKVALINDFEAVGYGVLGVRPEDLLMLQAGELQPEAPIGVIGAGTGLGEGFGIRDGNFYRVYPTEGGHTDYAPRNELEFQLLTYLLRRYQIDRISVERVVSGQGIVAIYQFLRDSKAADHLTAKTDPTVAQAVQAWERRQNNDDLEVDPAAAITQAALHQQDYLSEKTMQLFLEAYGAEAGNLALKLLPYGGLYIAGGVAAKNVELMQSGAFVQSFLRKGRMRPLMEKVPIWLVCDRKVGLLGAALKANQL